MNILRFLNTDCVVLDLATRPSEPGEDETPVLRERRLLREKDAVIEELAGIFDRSGAVVNPSKFLKDLINRERKSTTAILPGIALPHVRSLQVRQFVIGFARATGDGIWYASLDGRPTRLFFLLASPPYEDSVYLKVYKQFATMIREEQVVDQLLTVQSVQDVYNILRRYLEV